MKNNSEKKRALITGIEGQDGYYLARFLREKGYEVYGIERKKARHELVVVQETTDCYQKIYADMMEFSCLLDCVRDICPDEIYNLAGLSEVWISWRQPVLTAEVNGLGVLRLLEAMRLCAPKARFLQSSTSELFAFSERSLNENSAMATKNPYGTAKMYGHWITKNYRESFGMYACAALLFNHESPRRGVEFVTRKITASVARILFGMQEVLELGDLNAVRDWGSADDYVRAMWLMLQQEQPDDYVIATGVGHSVREFTTEAFHAGGIELEWVGSGVEETARDSRTGKILVKVDPKLFRGIKRDCIVGDPTKIQNNLGFHRQKTFEDIVAEMVEIDLKQLREKNT